MLVLGIESSCDETAAAVVRLEHDASGQSSGRVLSDVVHSQIASHAPFGGIVPEIAARDHMRAVLPVISAALLEANVELAELGGIAVTHRPGLVGALIVGLQAAKGLAWAADLPLVGVDHLVGHLLSVFLHRGAEPRPAVTFPLVGLLVSGGHTALYECNGPAVAQITELGATRDDAVGEAFDKIAKLLGLGYPGGPVIDRLARGGDADRCPLSITAPMSGSLEMSFSGVKSAIARHATSTSAPTSDADVADLCAAFQRVLVQTLVKKTLAAARQCGHRTIVVAGGVAANSELRASMASACERRGYALHIPPLHSCTDNAAMIAYAGAVKLSAGDRDDHTLAPSPRTSLPRIARKGRGKR